MKRYVLMSSKTSLNTSEVGRSGSAFCARSTLSRYSSRSFSASVSSRAFLGLGGAKVRRQRQRARGVRKEMRSVAHLLGMIGRSRRPKKIVRAPAQHTSREVSAGSRRRMLGQPHAPSMMKSQRCAEESERHEHSVREQERNRTTQRRRTQPWIPCLPSNFRMPAARAQPVRGSAKRTQENAAQGDRPHRSRRVLRRRCLKSRAQGR